MLTNPIAQEADCSLTLPPSLSDLDPDAESEHELSRLTLVVGDLHIDVGLPADVGIAAYINDVIDIANEQIAVREPASDVEFDETDGKWTLARLDGDPIDPHRSLSEAGDLRRRTADDPRGRAAGESACCSTTSMTPSSARSPPCGPGWPARRER